MRKLMRLPEMLSCVNLQERHPHFVAFKLLGDDGFYFIGAAQTRELGWVRE